jgi:hypothetical protein
VKDGREHTLMNYLYGQIPMEDRITKKNDIIKVGFRRVGFEFGERIKFRDNKIWVPLWVCFTIQNES